MLRGAVQALADEFDGTAVPKRFARTVLTSHVQLAGTT